MQTPDIHLPPKMYEERTAEDGKVYTYCTMRQIVLHTIGLDRADARVYHRHGRAFYKPYRNYFNTYVGEYPWPMLCEAGYAEMGKPHTHKNMEPTANYWLTRKGLDWLESEIGIHICDED